MPKPKQTGVDVLAVDPLWMRIVIFWIPQLYPRMAAGVPVLAGTFPIPAMKGKINDVELLFHALGGNMEGELSTMLNA